MVNVKVDRITLPVLVNVPARDYVVYLPASGQRRAAIGAMASVLHADLFALGFGEFHPSMCLISKSPYST